MRQRCRGLLLLVLLPLLLATVAVVPALVPALAGPGLVSPQLAAPAHASVGEPPVASASAGAPVGGARMGTRGVVAPPGAPALPAGLTAGSWVLADLDTGEVLAARNPHAKLAPASTLKALTALTLIPRVDRKRKVRTIFSDVAVEGSKVGLIEKGVYTIEELFTALMVVSGNDAANVLATAGGGHPRTLALMNAEARRLQARDTVARNPSGLDAPGQTSSAYDLALIARAGMEIPDFARYVGTKRSTISDGRRGRYEIYTHNRLLRGYPGAIGIKNGYTNRARASFMGAAQRGDRRLVVTLMRGGPAIHREAAALLDWGFRLRGPRQPVGQLVEPLAPALPDLAAAGIAGGDGASSSGSGAADANSSATTTPGGNSSATGGEQKLASGPARSATDESWAARVLDGRSWPVLGGGAALAVLTLVAGASLLSRARNRRHRARYRLSGRV